MSKINNYVKKIQSAKSFGNFIHTITNSINYRKSIFIVRYKNIKELLFEYKAYNKLKRKYLKILENSHLDTIEGTKNDTVWVCWLQGMKNAPLLVQKCFEKVKSTFQNKQVIVITSKNFEEYVKLPSYIIEKWKKGIISYAHFSDILRTWLLVERGGIWIDSTILILDSQLPDYLTEEKLFLFSNIKRNSIITISNWYICSYSHNKILESMKLLLTEYWKQENYAVHYLFYHILFTIVTEYYPAEWEKVPKFSNIPPHMLGAEIFTNYSKKREKELISMCPIQKLSNKFARNLPKKIEGTFYEHYIIK